MARSPAVVGRARVAPEWTFASRGSMTVQTAFWHPRRNRGRCMRGEYRRITLRGADSVPWPGAAEGLTFWARLAKSPPTLAARWMTWVGRNLAKIASVSDRTRRSPSLLERKIHSSLGRRLSSTYMRMAWPTRPDPPVTMMTSLPSPLASCISAFVMVRGVSGRNEVQGGDRKSIAGGHRHKSTDICPGGGGSLRRSGALGARALAIGKQAFSCCKLLVHAYLLASYS